MDKDYKLEQQEIVFEIDNNGAIWNSLSHNLFGLNASNVDMGNYSREEVEYLNSLIENGNTEIVLKRKNERWRVLNSRVWETSQGNFYQIEFIGRATWIRFQRGVRGGNVYAHSHVLNE